MVCDCRVGFLYYRSNLVLFSFSENVDACFQSRNARRSNKTEYGKNHVASTYRKYFVRVGIFPVSSNFLFYFGVCINRFLRLAKRRIELSIRQMERLCAGGLHTGGVHVCCGDDIYCIWVDFEVRSVVVTLTIFFNKSSTFMRSPFFSQLHYILTLAQIEPFVLKVLLRQFVHLGQVIDSHI